MGCQHTKIFWRYSDWSFRLESCDIWCGFWYFANGVLRSPKRSEGVTTRLALLSPFLSPLVNGSACFDINVIERSRRQFICNQSAYILHQITCSRLQNAPWFRAHQRAQATPECPHQLHTSTPRIFVLCRRKHPQPCCRNMLSLYEV